jgi:hypothetical protein
MRRHTLDPGSIRKQIISVFTSSSRKRQNSTNHNSGHNGILNFSRRTRRFSVPEKKYLDITENNPELHTIDEVSKLIVFHLNTLIARFAILLACC